MLRKRVALILAAGLLGSLGLVQPAQATHSWGGYHWAMPTGATEVSLKVGANVTSVWSGHLDTAITDWQASTVLALTRVSGQSNPKRCNPTAGRIEVCNSAYGKNGWLGLASIWASGGHITQATTKLNDSYFSAAPYNVSEWRNLVMCQEIGHDFGLAHQDETHTNGNLGTCMDYTNAPSSNQHPNQHDFDQLVTIYSHDETSSASSTSSGSRAQVGDDRASWGREVSRSTDGAQSIFELDLGNGEKVITHVTWALDTQAEARSGHDHAEHHH